MAGTGNDFIVFDNRETRFSGQESDFFAGICQRRVSVGADGVILVEIGASAPVRMRYFNKDGFESTMCGNGARCTAYFAREKGFVSEDDFVLEAPDGLHRVRVADTSVTLAMTQPHGFRSGYGIVKETVLTEGGFIDTGVPHYVLFAEDVGTLDVEGMGPFYRNHPVFPDGTNVNFVQVLGENRIRVRTFERGVEEETLSCGTGCVASALLTSKQAGYTSPITVLTKGGELSVGFDGTWQEVSLTGQVQIVFEAVLNVP